MSETDNLDRLFAAPLRGEKSMWPDTMLGTEVLAAAQKRLLYHGIAGLLFERSDLLEGWPGPLRALLREESLARAMWELRHQQLLGELLERLAAQAIRSVFLKGTALAYSVYDNAATRIRGDTDLLIAEANLEAVRRIFADLGWHRPYGAPGAFGPLHYQEVWRISEPIGFKHDVDLHWEVTNSRALRPVLDRDQVLGSAVPLPRLAPTARGPDPVTGLMHRAINRAVHGQAGYGFMDRLEYDPHRLIWACDLDLLARQLDASQWEALVERSERAGIGTIVGDALSFARQWLETPLPEALVQRLENTPRDTPATRYLTTSNRFAQAWEDLKATDGAGARARFLLARLFPSEMLLRSKYGDATGWPTWLLHMRRFAGAVVQFWKGTAA